MSQGKLNIKIFSAVSCGVGCRCSSDSALLWQWHRMAAVAPIRPLAWEPPYAVGVALKIKKKKNFFSLLFGLLSPRYSVLCICIIHHPDLPSGRNTCSTIKSNILLTQERKFLKKITFLLNLVRDNDQNSLCRHRSLNCVNCQ